MTKQEIENNEWPTYGVILTWLPVLIGFVLPLIVYSFYDSHLIADLLKENDEALLMISGFLFYSIPFIITSFLTRRDRLSKILFSVAFKKWVFRVIPAFVLYAFLLIDVTRSAAMKLPGASTAPVVLMFFPLMGSLLVFIGNCFVRNLESENNSA